MVKGGGSALYGKEWEEGSAYGKKGPEYGEGGGGGGGGGWGDMVRRLLCIW